MNGSNNRYFSGSTTPALNSIYTGFLFWGPHVDPATNRTNVRAMMANPPTSKGRVIDPVGVANIECKLNIADTRWRLAPWPISNSSGDAYEDWADVVFGFAQEADEDAFPLIFTKVLNAMSMLSGSGNHHSHDVDDAESNNAGTTYGCLVPSTRIYSSVYIVTLLLFVVLFSMIVVDLYDLIRTKLDKRHKEIEKMPFDMLEWQVALVEKMTGESIPTQRTLAGYEYFWDERTGRSHCRKIVKNVSAYPNSLTYLLRNFG